MTGRRLPRGIVPAAILALLSTAMVVVGYMAALYPLGEGQSLVALVAVLGMAAGSIVATVLWLGARRGLGLLAALAVYAYAIEVIGVTTGLPYGRFAYGAGMGPMLFGLVPLALPAAYVPLVLGAAAIATWAHSELGGATAAWLAAATAALVAADLVLDPGAVALGYWHYAEEGAYYGVPWTNFAGWALTGVAGAALCLTAMRPVRRPPGSWVASGMTMTTAFYTGVAFGFRMAVPLAVGAALVGLAAALAIRCDIHRPVDKDLTLPGHCDNMPVS